MNYKILTLIWQLGMALLAVAMFVSCSESDNKYTIAVSQCSDDIWRDKLNAELKTGEYLNNDITVRLASSNDDSKKQIRQINQFVDEGVDLLVISPNQLNAISPAINRAHDKGIPVILYDRRANTDKYTAFMGCDNYEVGKTMGNFIARQLGGNGRVVEIMGLKGSSPAAARSRGFRDAIGKFPGIKLVATGQGDWKEESGTEAMKSILAKTHDFDYVFAHNDRMAYGAWKAAQQQGLSNCYHYTGVDALANKGGGLELVRDKILEATYLYPTKGVEVIELAMKILQHKSFNRENNLSASIITHDNAEVTLMQARDAMEQQKYLDELHQQVAQYLTDYRAQKLLTIGLFVVMALITLVTLLVYRNYLIKARMNEQLAKKNEEIIELTHSRLVFFTNISHELRTPLTLIADPVEMLLEDKNIKGRSRDLLKMVKRNALSLQQLVGSILDFRKIQNGKMALKLHHFNIVEAITMWVGDFQLTAQRKQVALHLDVTGFTQEAEALADKEKVARIVFNLLSNALKYTPAGGEIAVTLRDADTKGALRLDVSDTGKGIEKEEQGKVFERFFQAKGAASGTGIGLALVKSFAELHHGEAHVESEPGKGADFYVVLPLRQPAQEVLTPTEEEETYRVDGWVLVQDDEEETQDTGKVQQVVCEDADRPTLLIIDDNDDIRRFMHTLLQDQYIVMEAADGKTGLDMARKEVPDLVVCDVMMPVMDGLEFTRQLKSGLATSHIPVILLTAKNLENQRAEGYEYGADSYVTKPFDRRVLLARIDNLLKQRRMLKEAFKGSSTEEKDKEVEKLDDRDKQFLRQLRGIIHAHMGESDFSVENIGREIGLSRVQLYRKVKTMTGSTVVDMLRKARLAKAKRLLESHSMSISEVAYEVGFSAPSYFTKCFKEEYGILPGDI